MTYTMGIDLGTTYSAAAVQVGTAGAVAEMVALGHRASIVPSAVFVTESGDVLIGDAALRRGAASPERLCREFKRRLGDSVPLIVGGSPFSAEALTARLLRWIATTVVEQRGEPPSSVTLTYPANWGAFKQERMAQAIRIAELADVVAPGGTIATLTEPEAAAISYAATERVPVGEVVAVYDLGGGTFDAAVLRKTPAGFEMLGSPEGIERLGGIDIDEAIYSYVRRTLGPMLDALDGDDPDVARAMARLRVDCVEAKEALSSDTQVSVPVLLPNLHTEVRLTRGELEGMMRPVLEDTIGALRRAIGSAEMTPREVDRVLLVGGSSRIPMVGQMVTEALGRPFFVDAHPKHAVALGAALSATGGTAAAGGTAGAGSAAAAAAAAAAAVASASGSPSRSVGAPPAVGSSPSAGSPPVGAGVQPAGAAGVPGAAPAPPPPSPGRPPAPVPPPPAPAPVPQFPRPGQSGGSVPPPPSSPASGQPVASPAPGQSVFPPPADPPGARGSADDTGEIQVDPTGEYPASGDYVPEPPPIRRRPTDQGGGNRRTLQIVAGVVLVAALGAAGFVALSGGGDDPPDDDGDQGEETQDTTGEDVPELALAGTTDVAPLPDGVAVDGDDVWVASTNGNVLQQLDVETGVVEQTFPVDGEPLAVVFTEGSVWVTQRAIDTVARIDPSTGEIVATIDVPDKPGVLAVGSGKIWVGGGGGALTRIDPADNSAEVLRDDLGNAAGVASADGVVWVSAHAGDRLLALDATTGDEIGSVPVGSRPDAVAVADSGIWVANRGEDTVSKIDPTSRAVLATVTVGPEPTGLVDDGDRVWVISKGDGTLVLVDGPSAEVVTQVDVGAGPLGLATSPGKVWVTASDAATVARVEVE